MTDCLIGIIKEPEDEELREMGLFNAVSLECNLPVGGKTKKEAAEKLRDSLNFHLKKAYEENRIPFLFNENVLEELMRYCAENGFPEALPDIEMGYGLRLRCYDLTKVAAKV